MKRELTLEDLVNQSELTLRTLRFYIQEGLLPGPDSRGKNARYTEEHLERLEWIQRLKEHHRPLREIRLILNNMTPSEIKALLEGQDKMQEYLSDFKGKGEDAVSGSRVGQNALDYIRGVEGKGPKIQEIVDPKRYLKDNLSNPASISPAKQENRSSSSFEHFPESWQRIDIGDGIELNLKMPIRSEDKARIDELITFARQLFRNIKNGENNNGKPVS